MYREFLVRRNYSYMYVNEHTELLRWTPSGNLNPSERQQTVRKEAIMIPHLS